MKKMHKAFVGICVMGLMATTFTGCATFGGGNNNGDERPPLIDDSNFEDYKPWWRVY